jgi:hypothetical protein
MKHVKLFEAFVNEAKKDWEEYHSQTIVTPEIIKQWVKKIEGGGWFPGGQLKALSELGDVLTKELEKMDGEVTIAKFAAHCDKNQKKLLHEYTTSGNANYLGYNLFDKIVSLGKKKETVKKTLKDPGAPNPQLLKVKTLFDKIWSKADVLVSSSSVKGDYIHLSFECDADFLDYTALLAMAEGKPALADDNDYANSEWGDVKNKNKYYYIANAFAGLFKSQGFGCKITSKTESGGDAKVTGTPSIVGDLYVASGGASNSDYAATFIGKISNKALNKEDIDQLFAMGEKDNGRDFIDMIELADDED